MEAIIKPCLDIEIVSVGLSFSYFLAHLSHSLRSSSVR